MYARPLRASRSSGVSAEKINPEDLRQRYVELLQAYLAERGEAGLFHAYEFSRECVRTGIGPEEIAGVHASVIEDLMHKEEMGPEDLLGANDLLLETMMAYAIAYKAYLEAESRQHHRLQSYAEQLKRTNRELEEKEQSLVEVNRELEAKTVEVSEANKRLQEQDRLKSQFVLTVSHELRTPLTSILGFSEFLLAGEHDSARVRQYLEVIHDQAERLTRLIDELLDLSRIEVGLTELDRREISVVDAITEAVDAFRGITSHTFVVDVEPLPRIWADYDKIVQVITNLLSNATRYSPETSVVTVTAKQVEEGVEIAIRDEGVGIPQEELEHIFERFYRIEPAPGGKAPGTGLGLALVRSLVELHGGRVTVESEPGRGTTFTILLPVGGS